jgi:hypothetical protein
MKRKKITLAVLCVLTLVWLTYMISKDGIYRTPENFFNKEDLEQFKNK